MVQKTFLAPVTSSFVPTVRITHLGQGLAKRQLWAYVEPNKQLLHLHQVFKRRARELGLPVADQQYTFTPHVHVATFGKEDLPESGISDWPMLTTFAAREAYMFKSVLHEGELHYEVSGSLPLTARQRAR